MQAIAMEDAHRVTIQPTTTPCCKVLYGKKIIAEHPVRVALLQNLRCSKYYMLTKTTAINSKFPHGVICRL